MKKTNQTQAQISNEAFLEKAQALEATVGGTPLICEPKKFKPGSVGFYGGGKIVLKIDGAPVRLQVSVSAVVIGSKPQA